MEKLLVQLLFIAVLSGCTHQSSVNIDNYTAKKIDDIIQHQVIAGDKNNPGEIIKNVSYQFLNTPYDANTLVGSSTFPEKLIIDFRGMDCLTFITYVEALSKSTSKNDFINKLIQTRYITGKVDFLHRKHFFID